MMRCCARLLFSALSASSKQCSSSSSGVGVSRSLLALRGCQDLASHRTWSLVAQPPGQDGSLSRALHTSLALHYAKTLKRDAEGKGRGHGKHKKEKAAPADEGSADTSDELSLDPYEEQMAHAVSHFQQELGRIHSGRATPGMLEPIEVQGHDERLPLRTYGTVTARGPALLVVTLFNPEDKDLVAKAIRESPLQLQARVEKKEIHVPVPKPSLEQLKGLMKLVRQEGEKAKLSVRTARQRAVSEIKAVIKSKDEKARALQEAEALTEKYVEQLHALEEAKDKELHELR